MLVVGALVAAVGLGSAGTFLAVAQAIQQPVNPLVQAVFTPPDGAPWLMTSDEWGVVVPGQAYMGYLETDGVAKLRQIGPPAVAVPGCPFTNIGQDFLPGLGVACPIPVELSGADLPAMATITVRVAGAAGEIQTCLHSVGVGTGPGGVPVSGDGWDCSRLTPPKFVPRTSYRGQ